MSDASQAPAKGWPISRKEYAGDLAYYSFIALLIIFLISITMFRVGKDIGYNDVIDKLCIVAVSEGEWDSQDQCSRDVKKEFDSFYEG